VPVSLFEEAWCSRNPKKETILVSVATQAQENALFVRNKALRLMLLFMFDLDLLIGNDLLEQNRQEQRANSERAAILVTGCCGVKPVTKW